MKTKLCFYGSAISAVAACLCAAPARHYASSAYSLWLSQTAGNMQLANAVAKTNHSWVWTMLAFAVLSDKR